MAEKGGYKHFMLKKIHEQPRAVGDTILGRVARDSGRVFLDCMEISEAEFRSFQQVKIIACGTSWQAGLAGKFMIEKLARIPVEVDYASEFRYRDPIMMADTLTIVISQSGETALHSRGSGDRSRLHNSIHVPDGRALPARHVSGPRERPSRRDGFQRAGQRVIADPRQTRSHSRWRR